MAEIQTGIVLEYNGYTAKVHFDAQDRIFVGKVIGVKDVIGFHGESMDELETHFHESIDSYLEACQELGQAPNKPYQGKIPLRVSPELHARLAAAAERCDKSLNQWLVDALESLTP